MKLSIFLVLGLLCITYAGVADMLKEGLTTRLLEDESTSSNINEVQTEHFDLDIDLDFNLKVFHGRQTIHLRTKKWYVNQVVLDISDLDIKSITDQNGNSLSYNINEIIQK